MQSELPAKETRACAGCSCLCDDIRGQELLSGSSEKGERGRGQETPSDESSKLCAVGLDWIRRHRPSWRHCVGTRVVELAEAVDAAGQLLHRSSAPLVCGLDGLCTEAQQAAWRLADQHRATIDTTLHQSGRGPQHALERVGRVTATLGEVAHRSDFVLFWFSDPVKDHPRHLERYSDPKNKPKKRLVVVDTQETETAAQADHFIRMERHQEGAALAVLRALLQERRVNTASIESQTGQPISVWQELINEMSAASYGSLFSTAPIEPSLEAESEQLSRLIRELNNRTRFVSLAMRADGNAQSAENVLAWSSGFTAAVNLNRGYPRSFYQEYSAESILARGETDLLLVASTAHFDRSWKMLNKAAREHFLKLPKIVLRETETNESFVGSVEISVSRVGFDASGDVCRQDDVPIRVKARTETSGLPSAKEVLSAVSAARVVGSCAVLG